MAAIDPSAKAEHTGTANVAAPPRATLKMVYDPSGPSDDSSDDSEEEENYLKELLEGRESDGLSDEDGEDESSDDEDSNGGPSDPSKSKKARKEAAAQELIKALAEQNEDNDSEDQMEVDGSPKMNGITKNAVASKGKGKAKVEASEQDEEDDDSEDAMDGMEEVVLCTLDPEKVSEEMVCSLLILGIDPRGRHINNPSTLLYPKIKHHTLKSLALTQFILVAIM